MKKISKLFIAVAVVLGTYFITQNSNANPTAPQCRWKVYDCPGWFTGDYEACVTIGDGNICECGKVTRDCDKPPTTD